MNSVYTSSSFSTTSTCSPAKHIRRTPFGVAISMQTCRRPPTWTSISTTSTVAPSGPYHAAKRSGSVHICQMTATGASKIRSITTASRDAVCSFIVISFLSSGAESCQVGVHAIEAVLPQRPVLLGPRRHLLEWRRVDRARPVLRLLSPHPPPGLREHLDVLGDRRQRHRERLRQLIHRGRAVGESGENRPTRRVGQRRERLAEPLPVGRRTHPRTFLAS